MKNQPHRWLQATLLLLFTKTSSKLTPALLLLTLVSTSVSAQTVEACDLGTQDWENGTNANPPEGWARIGSTNQAAPCGNCGEIQGKAIGFNLVGEGTASPVLPCVGTVTFDWHTSSGGAEQTVLVQWSQTPEEEASWQTFTTLDITGIGSAQRNYMTVEADLPEEAAVAPFGISVRWLLTARTSGTFYLDNICLTSGTCTVQPTQITFTQLPVTCIEVGAPFTVEACATDVNGFVATTFTGDITVQTGGVDVQGGTTAAATEGCVQLDLTATEAGDFTLIGQATQLAPATTPLSAEQTCPNEIDVRVMAYNLLNFPNGRDRCEDPNDIILLNREDTLANIIDYVRPDVLMVCELQDEIGSDAIIVALKGVDANYEAAEFVPNTSSIVKNLNNMLYYNSAKMTLVEQSVIPTNTRDISRYRMRMNDPKIATAPDTVFVDFFVGHTKAGSADPDRARRADDMATFQAAFDALEVENSVFGGDLNFYTSSEVAYQNLLTGANPWFDPIDAPGDWDNNVDFSDIHTQSSRRFGVQSYSCGISGGMDSRFDFLLHNGPIEMETMGVEYLEGSYLVPGNDGDSFNGAINDAGNNSGVPRDVLESLFFMSDHLPVQMDLRVTFPIQALPVELLSFEVGAGAGAKEVGLNWSVASERDFGYYGIERLVGQENWREIGRVDGGAEAYSFFDSDPAKGSNFYRLRMVDVDGTTAYSPVRSVNFGAEAAVYPTVTGGVVNVRGVDARTLRVLDTYGRQISVAGSTAQQLNLGGYAPGWYVLTDGGGSVFRVLLR